MTIPDDSLIETFRRDGFVVIDNFFDDIELDFFGSIVDRAVENRVGSDARPVVRSPCMNKVFNNA